MNKNVNTTTVAYFFFPFFFKLHFDFGTGHPHSSRPELRAHRKYITTKLSHDET